VKKTDKVERLEFNDSKLSIDLVKKEVMINGEYVTLTPIEYKLLTNLAVNPGRVYSRMDLLEKIQDEGIIMRVMNAAWIPILKISVKK
jgi:DNA-binding response OmpR family regulator